MHIWNIDFHKVFRLKKKIIYKYSPRTYITEHKHTKPENTEFSQSSLFVWTNSTLTIIFLLYKF